MGITSEGLHVKFGEARLKKKKSGSYVDTRHVYGVYGWPLISCRFLLDYNPRIFDAEEGDSWEPPKKRL